MDRKMAEAVMQVTHSMGELINKLSFDAETMENQSDKIIFKRSIGEIAIDIYLKIEQPIIRKFPDLDPDAN